MKAFKSILQSIVVKLASDAITQQLPPLIGNGPFAIAVILFVVILGAAILEIWHDQAGSERRYLTGKGKRHKKSCSYLDLAKHPELCGKDEGAPCKKCGG